MYKEYSIDENRGPIDLKILIIDFESVKNSDRFLTNMAKILIANKYLSNVKSEDYKHQVLRFHLQV
jgi:hypothetical protein